MVFHDFTDYDVMWVASKISGAAGALVVEVIELVNWLLRFRCASEELRVVVARLDDWMANPPSPLLDHLSHTNVMLTSVSG